MFPAFKHGGNIASIFVWKGGRMKKLFSNLAEKFNLFWTKAKSLQLKDKISNSIKKMPAFISGHKLIFAGAAFVLVAGVVLIAVLAAQSSRKNIDKNETAVTIPNPGIGSQVGTKPMGNNNSPFFDEDGQVVIQHSDVKNPSGLKFPPINILPFMEQSKLNEAIILVPFGARDPKVEAVQSRLMELWYMDYDEPTDYLGKYTAAALEAFQRTNDLKVNGELNAATYVALFEPSAKVYVCSVGDSGSDVLELQTRLYELGYLEKVTGLFNEETEKAVIQFQKANGIQADGKVGKKTKEQLYNPNAKPNVLSLSSQGDVVLKCQKKLKELGYLTTEADGVFGSDTQMAVRRFQAQNELIVDGYLGPTTRKLLLSDDAKGNALSYGMKGSDVQNVQKRLYKLNYLEAKYISSYYTDITESAVRLFQKNNGLQVDGKVGRNTMNKLFDDNAVRAKKPVKPGSGGGGTGSRVDKFIKIAKGRLGCPYVRGAKGPNAFDCSGLVYWCMNKAGIAQPYLTSYMWRTYGRYPRNTNINRVQRGDVIVYYGHVAIALGNWTMIDASHSKGRVVQRSFNSNWFRRNFICSYHIFGKKG